MISSKSFSSKIAVGALFGILNLTGCVSHMQPVASEIPTGKGSIRIAVLPVDNLSGGSAPIKELRQELIGKLTAKGMTILPDAVLDSFMARHRLRYVGGVDQATTEAFKDETGVEAVLVTSLELYNETFPPRIALTARMVATGKEPRIMRMESTAMAGNDSPGLFELGLITNPKTLTDKAIDRLANALVSRENHKESSLALPPEALYRPQALDPTRKYSVAVIPFFNKSGRKYAGEILALHFIRELTKLEIFNVVEPGVIRQELLSYRIIMEEGVSLADADLLFGMLKVDLLLTGNVDDYEDHQGPFGTPKVDFSALLLDRTSRKSVWAVAAHNTGEDHVHLFDFGRVNTANGLAAAMVRGAIGSLYK